MKKTVAILLAILLIASLVACGAESAVTPAINSTSSADTIAEAVTDQTITAREATGDFELTTEDGAFTESDGVYTITAAGTYTASGLLNGQILVEAGEEDEVVIALSGAVSVVRKRRGDSRGAADVAAVFGDPEALPASAPVADAVEEVVIKG